MRGTDKTHPSAASIPREESRGIAHAAAISIAMGSACEMEYHLLLARDLNFIDADTYTELPDRTTEVKRMLAALIQQLGEEKLSAVSDQQSAWSVAAASRTIGLVPNS